MNRTTWITSEIHFAKYEVVRKVTKMKRMKSFISRICYGKWHFLILIYCWISNLSWTECPQRRTIIVPSSEYCLLSSGLKALHKGEESHFLCFSTGRKGVTQAEPEHRCTQCQPAVVPPSQDTTVPSAATPLRRLQCCNAAVPLARACPINIGYLCGRLRMPRCAWLATGWIKWRSFHWMRTRANVKPTPQPFAHSPSSSFLSKQAGFFFHNKTWSEDLLSIT